MTALSDTINALLLRCGIRPPTDTEVPNGGEWTIALTAGRCSRCASQVKRGDRIYLVGERMWCREC